MMAAMDFRSNSMNATCLPSVAYIDFANMGQTNHLEIREVFLS